MAALDIGAGSQAREPCTHLRHIHLAKSLQDFLNFKEFTQAQIGDLKNLPDFGTTYGDKDQLSGTICSISGKQVLLLENSGKFTGPCERAALNSIKWLASK